jgi:hypothetical protein
VTVIEDWICKRIGDAESNSTHKAYSRLGLSCSAVLKCRGSSGD